ncbi:MAG: neutral/alkaline non-lysosomal ceramidase N-terminal domain-containing protein [Bryobacteraceae bacterium]|nr:neutral/alkaline non-lysosomal ceramidase N-terminal domain-containing protein [Bryobacteraceae bacterium]
MHLFLLALLAADFRAAVVKVDITPKTPQWLMGYGPRQSTGVYDPIFHKVVALDDGTTQFFLAASDLCIFSPSIYDEAAQRLQKQGIAPVNFWWTVTHTHAGPEVGPPGMYDVLLAGRSDHEWSREYAEFAVASLVQAVLDARSRLAPARLGTGTGTSFANINRRARDVDGRISLGLNPDGPVDRQIGLLRLDHPDGQPLALIANYAMHGTVMGGQFTQVSGDGPGTVAAYVESRLGVPMLYVNGAAGNIAPIYSVYPNPKSGHLSEFGVLLGDRILEANRALATQAGPVRLQSAELWVETPRKAGLGWPVGLERYTTAGRQVRLPVRFLRLNDTVLWAAPVEMFCELAFAVRAASPFRNTFFYGYTNGWLGYLPTAKAFEEGGYEPGTSPFTPRAENDVTRQVTGFLQGWGK